MTINLILKTFLTHDPAGAGTNLYDITLTVIYCLALIVFLVLFFVSAPYGKFTRMGWGSTIRSKWAWMIMEFPSPALMLFFFVSSDAKQLPWTIFIIMWLAHYIHRTFIYPFRQSGNEKPYPVLLVIMAFLFNSLNGFVNGYGVFWLYHYDLAWLVSWQFITGTLLFITGFAINKISDSKLRELRRKGDQAYVLPIGWLFNYISCPHYFGEMVEWGGWALLTWSLPGLGFFIFTMANLFPRAITSHRWYRDTFPDYPVRRKAVIPFII